MRGLVVGAGCMAFWISACGGGTPMETDGATDGATGTQGETTQATTPTSGTSAASQTGTESASGMSESQTDTTATPTGTTVDVTATGPETTTGTTGTTRTTLDTTDTTDGTTLADTSTGTTAASVGESSGESTDGTTSGTTEAGESSTTEPCVPATEVCNKLDDDCNDLIDDVDVGMDGICDCLSIALIGNQGSNPSSEFQMWLEDQGTTVERLNSNVLNDIDAPITPAVLAKYDIVIIDYLQRSYMMQEALDIRAWVEAGGGLMSLTGHVGSQVLADRDNSILGPLGLTYNTSAGFFSGPITQFNPHPITMGLTSITFLGGLFIDIVDDGIGMNQVIMTLPPGPVGVVQDRLQGQVFVFGDEWVEFDSQWQNMPEIKQFWVQSLAYLGPKDFCLLPQ